MKAKVIRFPGNSRPAVRHGRRPIVVIMPVIKIERLDPATLMPIKRRRRRSLPRLFPVA